MKLSLLFLALMAGATLQAQDDITPYYMVNGDFDLRCNYDATRTTNVGGDIINTIYGWTNASTATYTVAGTFEWNGKARFNSGSAIPANGYDNRNGGGLALSTGWGQTLAFTQTVSLPKGTYRLATAAYNTGTNTKGTLKLSFKPDNGSETATEIANLPSKAWTTGDVEFTLTAKKSGTITIAFTSESNTGSNSSAKPIIDYVHLLAVDMDLTTPLSDLRKAINSANTQYGDGSKVNADKLKAVIDRAQAIYDDNGHTAGQILSITAELTQATTDNKLDNASATSPYTVTTVYLTNPSFENGTTGWTIKGMNTQTNSYFSKKSGNTYLEAWVNSGDLLGSCSAEQQLADIPNGRYRLRASALAIQQSGANSTTNKGDKQTGTVLFAGNKTDTVTSMKTYEMAFVVLDGQAAIGIRCHNATANWVCVDNFTLAYLGRITAADHVYALQTQIDNIASDVLPCRMQNSVRAQLENTIQRAKEFIASAEGLSADQVADNTTELLKQLADSTTAAQTSIDLFADLAAAIDYATQVAEWIAESPAKQKKVLSAIETARDKYDNLDITTTTLKSAAKNVRNTAQTNDRQIYTAEWSMGTVSDPNNKWYTGRTIQSKNWVLFWEKPYGDEAPVGFRCGSHTVNAWETIEHAQRAFDFYTDSLHFINRSTSKTNQYKMVIRLRYEESEWEATGSGVDDQIGLLTLTPWAQTSRNWQTTYHEVGHCFQYQTHCDNGDWNGWMYGIGPLGLCGFWEQCAQWQAYKIMPYDQFTNEWFGSYMNQVHKHVLHEGPRYENFFIQDYWTMRHGWDFVGRLWNESRNPEDACEAYQRITGITNSQFNDEIWDCAARFATWDIPHFEKFHNNTWQNRPQPKLNKDSDKYWVIDAANAPENTGHNIIKLNVPTVAGAQVTACFEGLGGDDRFRQNEKTKAGWRYGFVALKKDGTRVYGDMGSAATYKNPKDTIRFNVPEGCTNLWFVVSGAATTYLTHGWDDDDTNDEQFGYRVRFDSTNLLGQTNDHITGISTALAGEERQTGIYTLSGMRLNVQDPSRLPAGMYIINGQKTMVR